MEAAKVARVLADSAQSEDDAAENTRGIDNLRGLSIYTIVVPYPEWLYGAAGINISALDLAKFDAALAQGTLLKKSSLEQMWTPYRLTNGELGRFTDGWMTSLWNGHRLVFHLGGDLVVYAHLVDEGISIIWFTNLDPSDPYGVVYGILQRMSH